MAPWVLESSYRYAKASAMLLNAGLMGESEVNAALSMELLLKSLLVVPVENSRKGTVAQQYTLPRSLGVKDGHDLHQLYLALPQPIIDALSLADQEEIFRLKRGVFKHARYCYEEKAPQGYDSLLLQCVAWLLPQVVVFFVNAGCVDSWVAYMRCNPQKMRLDQLGATKA